ncbi:ABC transporter substrate-binding protein [Amycolatopsis anabasis]|uniref:ABC transporter substrate-binding protein n=1 Tax=Amycolatopsis anabasis TaxID=1840409 RepID=UPI00131E0FC0|nr:ABC transporter substrate-binding protein [Amycolatopsis anabasis]
MSKRPPLFRARARASLAALAAGALSLGLVACGNVQDSSSQPSSAPAAQPGAFPVSITHKFGTTTIDKSPAKVVVVGTSTDDLDAALALGVTPVGFFSKTSSPEKVPSWLTGKLDPAKTQIVNATNGVDAEAVRKLSPDLILATADYGLEDEYPNLVKVAPTIGFEKEWGGQSWQQHVQVVGKALGKPAEAETLIKDTEAKIAKAKADHPGAQGKTFTASVGNAPGKIFTLVSKDDFAVKLVEQLGLTLNPAVADATKNEAGSPTGTLTPEQYDKLASNLVIIAFTSPELRKAFEDNQLVQNVKNGNYLVVDMETISQLRAPSALGIPWVIEKLNPGLRKLT